MTDNRTNEQIVAEELAYVPEECSCHRSTAMDLARDAVAALREAGRLTDGQLFGISGEFTDEQVEAAAKAVFMVDYWHQGEEAWEAARLDGNSDRPDAFDKARAALEAAARAAQGAAPQAEAPILHGRCQTCGNEVFEGDADEVIEHLSAPELPSSTESPVEPFKTWFACWWKNEPNAVAKSNAQSAFYAGWDARGLPSSGVDVAKIESLIMGRTATAGARAVAAWLKGQGGDSRG